MLGKGWAFKASQPFSDFGFLLGEDEMLNLSCVATITVLSIKMNLTRFQFCKWIQLLLLDRPAI